MKRFIACFLVWCFVVNFGNTIFSSEKKAPSAIENPNLVSVQEYYSLLTKYFQEDNCKNLLYYSQIIIRNFADTSFAHDALYYQAVAYFNLKD